MKDVMGGARGFSLCVDMVSIVTNESKIQVCFLGYDKCICVTKMHMNKTYVLQ